MTLTHLQQPPSRRHWLAGAFKARLKDVEEFVRSKSERHVMAPPPKYTGHIVAHDIDHRWAADIISFVSRPTTTTADAEEEAAEDEETASRRNNFARLRPLKPGETTMSYVLLVQDIFSRQLFAKPLQSVSDATGAFKQILAESVRSPRRLDTDGGTEFTGVSSALSIILQLPLCRVSAGAPKVVRFTGSESARGLASLWAASQSASQPCALRFRR